MNVRQWFKVRWVYFVLHINVYCTKTFALSPLILNFAYSPGFFLIISLEHSLFFKTFSVVRTFLRSWGISPSRLSHLHNLFLRNTHANLTPMANKAHFLIEKQNTVYRSLAVAACSIYYLVIPSIALECTLQKKYINCPLSLFGSNYNHVVKPVVHVFQYRFRSSFPTGSWRRILLVRIFLKWFICVVRPSHSEVKMFVFFNEMFLFLGVTLVNSCFDFFT